MTKSLYIEIPPTTVTFTYYDLYCCISLLSGYSTVPGRDYYGSSSSTCSVEPAYPGRLTLEWPTLEGPTLKVATDFAGSQYFAATSWPPAKDSGGPTLKDLGRTYPEVYTVTSNDDARTRDYATDVQPVSFDRQLIRLFNGAGFDILVVVDMAQSKLQDRCSCLGRRPPLGCCTWREGGSRI